MRVRPALLAAIAAMALALPLSATAAPGGGKGDRCRGQNTPITTDNVARSERTLHCLVNSFRANRKRSSLAAHPELARAARGHSRHMEETGRLQSLGIGDGTPYDRATAAGFDCGGSNCIGENVTAVPGPVATPKELFRRWKRSRTHRRNMLRRDYVATGTGIALGPELGITATQMLATVDDRRPRFPGGRAG